jgi:hypothetical protein
MAARKILEKGVKMPELREEIFFQLVKQSTKNPKHSSLVKCWQLLAICISTWVPGRKFGHHLSVWMENAHLQFQRMDHPEQPLLPFVDFARYQFLDTMKSGSRKVAPDHGEILLLAKSEHCCNIPIDTIRGETRVVRVSTHSTQEDVSESLAKYMGLTDHDLVFYDDELVLGLFEVQYNLKHRYLSIYQIMYKSYEI